MLLAAPGGTVMGDILDVTPIEHHGLRDPLVADVLADVLSHLRINWD